MVTAIHTTQLLDKQCKLLLIELTNNYYYSTNELIGQMALPICYI